MLQETKRKQGRSFTEKFIEKLKLVVDPQTFAEIAKDWQEQEDQEEVKNGEIIEASS